MMGSSKKCRRSSTGRISKTISTACFTLSILRCISKKLAIILLQTCLDRVRIVETIDFTRRDDSKRCCRTGSAGVVSRGGGGDGTEFLYKLVRQKLVSLEYDERN
ncbi:unnamed protein product [Tenebrio molitor]|nr:unnamed protein product [Tenebrio molitor]